MPQKLSTGRYTPPKSLALVPVWAAAMHSQMQKVDDIAVVVGLLRQAAEAGDPVDIGSVSAACDNLSEVVKGARAWLARHPAPTRALGEHMVSVLNGVSSGLALDRQRLAALV